MSCFLYAILRLGEGILNRMWLAQFVSAPQFFKTPSGLCGHTVHMFTSIRYLL
jgi:hypothetical protein